MRTLPFTLTAILIPATLIASSGLATASGEPVTDEVRELVAKIVYRIEKCKAELMSQSQDPYPDCTIHWSDLCSGLVTICMCPQAEKVLTAYQAIAQIETGQGPDVNDLLANQKTTWHQVMYDQIDTRAPFGLYLVTLDLSSSIIKCT